jgi:hypothetical protein
MDFKMFSWTALVIYCTTFLIASLKYLTQLLHIEKIIKYLRLDMVPNSPDPDTYAEV